MTRKSPSPEALRSEIVGKSGLQLVGRSEASPQSGRIAAGSNHGNRPEPAASVRKRSKKSSLRGDSEIHKRATMQKSPSRESVLPNLKFGGAVPRILDLKAAEAYSGLSQWTLRDLILAGHIARVLVPDVLHPGRNLTRVLTTPEAIDAFIKKHLTGEVTGEPGHTRGSAS